MSQFKPCRGATARLALPLAALLVIAACDSGGSDSGSNATTGGGGQTTAGATTGGDTGAGGTTGGDTGSSSGGDTTSADLSQAGTLIARVEVDTATADLVSAEGRARAAALPDNFGVIYEVIENHGGDTPFNCAEIGAQYASCSVTNLHIKDAAGALSGSDWRLYFHSLRRILRADSDDFEVYSVNGDLNYLTPAAGYDGFDGNVESVRFISEYSQLMDSDFMPRYWLVQGIADGNPSVTLAANTDENTNELNYAMPITGSNATAYNGETIPVATTTTRFAANADTASRVASLSPADIQSRIVPRPSAQTSTGGQLEISGGVSFAGGPLSSASVSALSARQATFMSSANQTPISMSIDTALGAEAYTLDVDTDGITIVGGDETGVFYGAQSVLSLVQPGVGTIPTVSVADAPRFSYRGMHVDAARNFRTVDTIKRVMDQMAAYKLNTLHLHMSDDEGWRLEIPSLPELTSVGATRQFQLDANGDVFEGNSLMPQLGSGPTSSTAGSGFYSRAEYIDLLEYAAARHINVIPAFDMPAHARAAVVAMRARASNLGDATSTDIRIDDPADGSRYRTVQNYDDGILNPCIAGTYSFVDTVVSEVQSMYNAAGATLDVWHMGGDEAFNVYKGPGYTSSGASYDVNAWDFPWELSPACDSYIQNTAGVNSREDLQSHFLERVSEIVGNAGIPALYAYHDIFEDRPASDLATQRVGSTVWEVIHRGNHDRPADYVNRGYETIITSPDYLYFDFPQEVDPEERGQYWAARATNTRKVFTFSPTNLPQNAETSTTANGDPWTATGSANTANFLGMQGQLWSETVRTPAQADYMVFPRLLALAERAWHQASWELDYSPGTTFSATSNLVNNELLANDWATFAAALGNKELAKLDAAGVQYRIPVPGVRTSTGVLEMNIAYPGLPLEAGSGSNLSAFVPGSTAAGVTDVRARSATGSRSGRTDSIE